MSNTSEIDYEDERKLEIIFALQEKLMIEHGLDPKNLTLFQRGDKILKSWDMASEKMSVLKNNTVSELFKDNQAEALLQYAQIFTWIVNIGIYLGIDAKLLFNLYRFHNEERRRGIHS